MNVRTPCMLAASVLALAVHGQAMAQAAGSEAASSDTAVSGIGDIIVTAQKRSENLQKTPAAVTAVSGEALVAKGINNLATAQEVVPGARFHVQGNTTQVFLRGVGSNLDFANVQPSVAFNFNGVYTPREGTSVGFYDIDRFEVLPGPQGTLYGRSAIGGTVNVGFKRPEFRNGGSIDYETGNYGLQHVTAVGNAAVSDTLAFRLAADYNYHSGYQATGSDSREDVSARLGALYKPNDNVSLYWWGYTAHKYGRQPNISTKGSRPVYDANGTLTGLAPDENAYLQSDPYNDYLPDQLGNFVPLFWGQVTPSSTFYNNWVTGAQLDIKLGGDTTLTYIPGYFFLNSRTNLWWLGSIPAWTHNEYHQTTHELRLAGNTGRLDWLLGLYAYHTIQQGQFILGSKDGPNGAAIPHTPFPFYGSRILRNRLQGLAGFGQVTYKLTDELRLTGGARYGVDDTSAYGISPADQVTPYSYDRHKGRFDYKVGAQYDLTPKIMLYVQYQTGYQPASFNEFAATPTKDNQVAPATMKSISGGFKARFFGNTLQINDEVFYSVYRNYQIQAYDATQLYNPIFNAKKVTIPGNQLDILWQPTADDRVNLSVSYIKNRNKDFVDPTTNVSYNGLAGPYAADWTISGGVSHDFRMESGYVRASADARYESKWWADFVHNPGTRQDPYAKVNADLTYYSEDGSWNIGIWGRNLTNKAVIAATAAAPLPGPAVAGLDDPRTYGLRAGYKF